MERINWVSHLMRNAGTYQLWELLLSNNWIVHDLTGDISELNHSTHFVFCREYLQSYLKVFHWVILFTLLIKNFILEETVVWIEYIFQTKKALLTTLLFDLLDIWNDLMMFFLVIYVKNNRLKQGGFYFKVILNFGTILGLWLYFAKILRSFIVSIFF
jgi:hypothetical protein